MACMFKIFGFSRYLLRMHELGLYTFGQKLRRLLLISVLNEANFSFTLAQFEAS